jgi:hypothetical protein
MIGAMSRNFSWIALIHFSTFLAQRQGHLEAHAFLLVVIDAAGWYGHH